VEPTGEPAYKRRIAELEAENAALKKEVSALKSQVADLVRQNAQLAEQIARLSKNSANSSKPPSSDIVKPPQVQRSKKRRRPGGQPGHPGVGRLPFTSDQIDQTRELPAPSATLAQQLRKHGEAIFRFLFDSAVPPTNNGGEQSLRQLVIDRRITQGSRSRMGRQGNARIWTVLAACRKQSRSAWQFLQNALSAYYFHSPTPSFLPQT